MGLHVPQKGTRELEKKKYCQLFGESENNVYICTDIYTSLIQENMETTIKRTREEVRAAFREVMRKKRERVQKSRENLEVMYQQGLFNY